MDSFTVRPQILKRLWSEREKVESEGSSELCCGSAATSAGQPALSGVEPAVNPFVRHGTVHT